MGEGKIELITELEDDERKYKVKVDGGSSVSCSVWTRILLWSVRSFFSNAFAFIEANAAWIWVVYNCLLESSCN